MKTNLKKLLALCLAGIVTAGMAISASAVGVYKVTTNNETAGNEAVLCIDGDDTRLWHTNWINGPFEPPYILTFELDEASEISSIGLYPRQDGTLNGLPYALNINVSDDGVNFTTVEEVDWLEYTYDLQTIELKTPVTTKFLQLEILDTEGYEFASLNQLYINGEAALLSEAGKAALQNAIADALATNGLKSIVADNDHPDNLAVYAADNNYSRFWHTDWNDSSVKLPLNIIFELDNLYSVTEFTILNRPDSSSEGVINGAFIDYNIYSSLDGENFTLVQTVTDQSVVHEPQTVVLDQPMITRYIRLEATKTSIDEYGISIGMNYGSMNQFNYVGTVVDEASLETEAPAPETEAPVVETEAPAAAETVTETVEVPAAPQTFDFGVIAAIAAVISAAGYAVTRRRV